MRIVLFYHSLISDWNHGNAHFLRGVATELIHRGHQVKVYEPRDAWSVSNLIRNHGILPIAQFHEAYPELRSLRYELSSLDLDEALDGADLVLVHEWNDPELVRRIGEHRARSHIGYRLLFHDTHHRMVTQPSEMAAFDLRNFDGVLAFGRVIADLYLERGLTNHAWIWHEAADTRIFYPRGARRTPASMVWIGNWGDDERTEELREFLIEPASQLNLAAEVYGVRYPEQARVRLESAGIRYRGWTPNFQVPEIFSRFLFTVHVPRGPYVRMLPGIPTIRVFEALSCGIPLISAPWDDAEGLFSPGEDFLMVRDGQEMKRQIERILHDPDLADALSKRGRQTILKKHTCAHRVDELFSFVKELDSTIGGKAHAAG